MAAPRRVGGWEVLGELGRGGQGVVLRARHVVHGTPAAVKLLLRQELKTVLRFRQEAAVLQRLNHPNLVRILEVGEHDGAPFLAMELVTGQSLADLVREGGPPPFERTVRLLAAVARAVHHCHTQGVVHRDLKPENVIVERDTGRAVLVDFGMVKRDRELFGALSIDELANLTKTGELRGTPLYMAPEQVAPGKEFGDVGPWSDVYALGAMLHVLLTGEPPWSAASLPTVVGAILFEPAPDSRDTNPAVPVALARLCMKARSKQRADRPPSAAAFAAALEAARREGSRRAVPAVLAVAALVVVGGGVAGAVVARRRAPVEDRAAPPAVATTTTPPPAAGEGVGQDDLVERALERLATEPEAALTLAEEALAGAPAHLRGRCVRALARRALERRAGGRSDPGAPELREVVTAEPTLGWAATPDGAPDPRLLEVWTDRAAWKVERGDLEGALADAGVVLALRTDDPRALVVRAQAHCLRKDGAAALRDAERALAALPGLIPARRLRAEARLLGGDPKGALEDAAAVLSADPQDPVALFADARARAALRDHQGAIESLTRLLVVQPDAPAALLERGLARAELGDHAGAIADYDRAEARSSEGDLTRLLLERGRSRLARGDVEGARNEAARCVALAPGRWEGWLARAVATNALGDRTAALLDLDQAVARAPKTESRALAQRAELRRAAGDGPGAVADAERVVELAPDAKTWHDLGLARRVARDDVRAIEAFTRSIELYGETANALPPLQVRASCRRDAGDLAGALKDLERGTTLAPAVWNGWYDLGYTRQKVQDLPGAIEAYGRAIALAKGPDLVNAHTARAWCHRTLEQFARAVPDYDRALELAPERWGLWHDRAYARDRSGDHAGALADYDRALELAKEPRDVVTVLLARGLCHRTADELAAARADYDKAVELAPERWGAWHDRAYIRDRTGDHAGAVADHGRSVELARGPDLVTALLDRALCHRAADELALSRADYDRAVELAPERWGIWHDRAYIRQRQGDHQGALEDLDRAIALAADKASPYRLRSTSRRALRDWAGAEADCTKALALEPNDGPSWSAQGWLELRRGDLEAARRDFTRSMELGHDPGGNLRLRAGARRDLGDTGGALADLALAVEKAPRSVDVLLARAYLLREWRRDLAGARRDEDAAVALDPTLPGPWRSRALTRLLQGDPAGARTDADEAVRRAAPGPATVEVLASRARLLAALGDAAAAKADAERAVALDPGSNLAHWAHALALLAGRDAAGAVEACGRAVAADPRSPRALATRAEALATLGRPAEALADLDRAVALEPGRPDPLLQRAGLREASGDRAGAAADLRAALACLAADDPRRAPATSALERVGR